ncbi:hypothetical protein ALC53_13786 [Atta colombica]|uniref:Uncharacterized protein n=1 Tax=Atta colombica TaxID=520822 RepID=A0A195AU15_9HYME|nr:hypothetical protein ALC53_13786 [Atta colombica]
MIPLNPEKPGKAEGGDLEALCQKLEEKRGEKCGRNRDCNAGLIGEPPLIGSGKFQITWTADKTGLYRDWNQANQIITVVVVVFVFIVVSLSS